MELTMKDVMTANCAIQHAEMLTSNHCAALARELNKMLAAATVPPAGVICDEVAPITEQAWRLLDSPPADEVEVLGAREVMTAYENADALHLSGTSNFCGVMAKHLNKAVSAHVARLTAENARLEAEVERRGRCYTTEKNLRREVQSALTAERDQLIADCWQACGGNGPSNREDLLTALRLMNEAEDELTAERDALKAELAELADLKAYVTLPLRERCAQRLALQSELTKARELLEEPFQLIFEAYSRPADTFNSDQEWAVWQCGKVSKSFSMLQKLRVALSNNQSAPATKGDCPECGGTGDGLDTEECQLCKPAKKGESDE